MHIWRSTIRVGFVSLAALQLSCSGEPSGPGNVATTMSANSATTISASTGAQISDLPSVIVFDQTGAPMSGVAVTFAASGGGGAVTGGSQVTNAQGIATVGGWTLGTTPGGYTVIASSSGLPPVTFTANAGNPCAAPTSLAFGTTVSGALTSSDCSLTDGSYIDFYQVTLPSAGTYRFNQSSSTLDSFLFLYSGTDAVIGFNDDDAAQGNLNSAVKAILPAGAFRLGANSFEPNETGTYTLSSAASPAGITNCEEVWVVRGISTAQELQATDCTPSATPGSHRWDNYLIVLEAGQSMTVTMTATMDCLVEVYTPSSVARAAFSQCSANTATLTFTPTSTNVYVVRATAATAVTGSYTLSVQ
jgi:hypothetical protein